MVNKTISIQVMIPAPLRRYTDNQNMVEVSAQTAGEALSALTSRYGALQNHLFNEEGQLRSFVNVYLNDDDIRYLQGMDTQLLENMVISIIPSIAGGSQATLDKISLSKNEVARYSRHLIIPEIGMEGQLKLKKARVLIIGTGGLGAPLGLYLAAAGVGTIGLVDFDTVDMSNLQRQVIYSTSDVGRPKLDAARERLLGINPEIQVQTYNTRLTSQNALELFADYDIIVDGTDNFPTRYLVNDACVFSGKPNVYGSIFRFDGQVSIFYAKEGPCYRCLYPEPPPPGLVPSCAEGGVLGVLPGIVGSLQALETIKLIVGTGTPMLGRLLVFDALKMSFRELKLRKDPNCSICGNNPTLTELIDYEQFCGINPQLSQEVLNVDEISVLDLKHKLEQGDDLFILDVRESHEYDICHISEHLIPLNELSERLGELNPEQAIVVHCRSGVRSAKAVQLLTRAGFSNVKNLAGGILDWADKIDPNMPKY